MHKANFAGVAGAQKFKGSDDYYLGETTCLCLSYHHTQNTDLLDLLELAFSAVVKPRYQSWS